MQWDVYYAGDGGRDPYLERNVPCNAVSLHGNSTANISPLSTTWGWITFQAGEVQQLQTPAGPSNFPDSTTYLNTIHHIVCQQPPLRSQGLLSQPLDMRCLEMPCHGMLPWQACWPKPLRSCRQPLSAPTLHLCLGCSGLAGGQIRG